MAKEHKYETKLVWTGEAQGATSSYTAYSREYAVQVSGKPLMKGSADPMFRGDPTLHNPEDLMVASLAACHMLTYLAHASLSGLLVTSYEDNSSGTMVFAGGGGRFTEVMLRPKVTITKESDKALALELHEKSHKDCFIASSVNFPVKLTPEIIVG